MNYQVKTVVSAYNSCLYKVHLVLVSYDTLLLDTSVKMYG